MNTLTPAIKYDLGKRKPEKRSVELCKSWQIPHIHIERFPFLVHIPHPLSYQIRLPAILVPGPISPVLNLYTSLLLLPYNNPQHEVDHHSREQRNREHRRAQPIIKPALAPLPYALRAPMERKQRIYHSRHSDQREQSGADAADFIAEVQQPDCEAAEDNGEVEPA